MIDGTNFLVLAYSDVQNNKTQWNQPIDEVKELAKDSTRVAIQDEEGNYVVSIAETNPIQRMREGKSLSHDGSNNQASVLTEWTASDSQLLERLPQGCGKPDNNLEEVVQHACGNGSGLHWTAQHGFRSQWNWSQGEVKLQLAIDIKIPEIENCETQSVDGECLACTSGQQLASNDNVCVPEIANCETYDSTGECLACQSGYVEVTDNVCVPKFKNCNNKGDDDKCLSCESGYKLSKLSDQKTKQVNIKFQENRSNEKLLQFSAIQLRDNNNKKINISSVSCTDCNQYSTDSPDKIIQSSGKFCDKNFQKNGQTEILIKFKKKSSIAKQRFKTANDNKGRDPRKWEITTQPEMINVDLKDNQKFPSGRNKWTSQQKTNQPVGDECVLIPVIEHCQTYNTTGACIDCEESQVEVADDKCKPEIENCETYDNTGACLTCQSDQVEAADNVCVPEIENCETYDNTGACLTCQSGYVEATDNVCVSGILVENCETQGYNGQCLACTSGQQLASDDNVCVPEIENCNTYNTTGACLTCQSGYVEATDNVCVSGILVENCETQGVDGLCSTCASGYKFSKLTSKEVNIKFQENRSNEKLLQFSQIIFYDDNNKLINISSVSCTDCDQNYGESPNKIRQMSGKFCDVNFQKNGQTEILIKFSKKSSIAKQQFNTANDMKGRDPKEWVITTQPEMKNVDFRDNQTFPSGRHIWTSEYLVNSTSNECVPN